MPGASVLKLGRGAAMHSGTEHIADGGPSDIHAAHRRRTAKLNPNPSARAIA